MNLISNVIEVVLHCLYIHALHIHVHTFGDACTCVVCIHMHYCIYVCIYSKYLYWSILESNVTPCPHIL